MTCLSRGWMRNLSTAYLLVISHVYLVDPFLIPNWDKGPIDVPTLLANFQKAPASTILSDGISAVIGVVVESCAVLQDPKTTDTTLQAQGGATLLEWDPLFLTPAGKAITQGAQTLTIKKADFVNGPNGCSGLFLLQAPPANTPLTPASLVGVSSSSVLAGSVVSLSSSALNLHPRPVVFVHGLWGNIDTFKHVVESLTRATTPHPPAAPLALWSNSWDLTPICYSKILAFDAPSDPFSEMSNECEVTSASAVSNAIEQFFSNENVNPDPPSNQNISYNQGAPVEGGIVGGQVDLVVHSMGGLVARNFIAEPNFRSPRNRMQGVVNTVITLDSPETGSNLANYLVANAYMAHSSSLTGLAYRIWASPCSKEKTLANCFNKLGNPEGPPIVEGVPGCIGSDPYGCGAVASLMVGSPNIARLPSVPSNGDLAGGWLAVASEYPPDYSTPSSLRIFIESMVDSINNNAGPSDSAILGDSSNDVIATVASQLSGTTQGQPYVPLAHAPLPFDKAVRLYFEALGTVSSNVHVLDSAPINKEILCGLQNAGAQLASQQCAKGASGPGNTEFEVKLSHSNAQTSQELADAEKKIFVANERLNIQKSTESYQLGQTSLIPVTINRGTLTRVFTGQEVVIQEDAQGHTDTKQIRDSIQETKLISKDGQLYVQFKPLALGDVELGITMFFADGGTADGLTRIQVVPPDRKVQRLTTGQGADPMVSTAVLFGRYTDDPKSRMDAWVIVNAFYDDPTRPIEIDPRYVTFTIRQSTGTPPFSISGSKITALHYGNAILETTYGGVTNLNCVVISDKKVSSIGNKDYCQSQLREGEKLAR